MSEWTANDDLTWLASAVFGFFWILPLSIETIFRFKRGFLWITVTTSIVLNVFKLLIVINYNEFLRNPSPNVSTGTLYKILEVANVLVYLSYNIAMYIRKKAVVPSKWHWDLIMLILISVITVAASVLCVVGIHNCWVYSGLTVSLAILLTVAYFDFYYCYCVFKSVHGKFAVRRALQAMMPSVWTSMTALAYVYGSTVYSIGVARFYSNAIWNFASVLLPLVTIQSNISTNVGGFLASFKNPTDSSAAVCAFHY